MKMGKPREPLILIGIGLAMNLIARLIAGTQATRSDVTLAGIAAGMMLVSVALVIFGVIRLIIVVMRSP